MVLSVYSSSPSLLPLETFTSILLRIQILKPLNSWFWVKFKWRCTYMPIRIGAKDLLCLCLRTEFHSSSIGKESVTPTTSLATTYAMISNMNCYLSQQSVLWKQTIQIHRQIPFWRRQTILINQAIILVANRHCRPISKFAPHTAQSSLQTRTHASSSGHLQSFTGSSHIYNSPCKN